MLVLHASTDLCGHPPPILATEHTFAETGTCVGSARQQIWAKSLPPPWTMNRTPAEQAQNAPMPGASASNKHVHKNAPAQNLSGTNGCGFVSICVISPIARFSKPPGGPLCQIPLNPTAVNRVGKHCDSTTQSRSTWQDCVSGQNLTIVLKCAPGQRLKIVHKRPGRCSRTVQYLSKGAKKKSVTSIALLFSQPPTHQSWWCAARNNPLHEQCEGM